MNIGKPVYNVIRYDDNEIFTQTKRVSQREQRTTPDNLMIRDNRSRIDHHEPERNDKPFNLDDINPRTEDVPANNLGIKPKRKRLAIEGRQQPRAWREFPTGKNVEVNKKIRLTDMPPLQVGNKNVNRRGIAVLGQLQRRQMVQHPKIGVNPGQIITKRDGSKNRSLNCRTPNK